MEAEYVATSDAAKEALWLGRLAVTFEQSDPTWTLVVLSDNQGGVALARNSVHQNASKHIEVRYHFVREFVTHGKLSLDDHQESSSGLVPVLERAYGRGADFGTVMTEPGQSPSRSISTLDREY